jgi:DNA-binding IscR family transcriptional regulator
VPRVQIRGAAKASTRIRKAPDEAHPYQWLCLAGAGILRSAKGPHGGYRLAKPAQQIILLEIVEAVDGPIRGEAPPVGQGEAAAALDRRLQEVCDVAAALVRRRLAQVTLAELEKAK